MLPVPRPLSRRTLVIGDVHGCADELAKLCDAHAPDDVVLVGDLFTKGPDPAGVWAQIRDRGMRAVLGNHDERLIDVLRGARPDDDDGRACVAALDAADPGWRTYLHRLPLFREVFEWTVVHAALHPLGSLALTRATTATRLRRWPRDRATDPRWWEVYEGPRRVLFGHDARRGYVQRERHGVPWLVGLDTGCVYGGHLTGWLVDEGRPVQVPARRVYRAVG